MTRCEAAVKSLIQLRATRLALTAAVLIAGSGAAQQRTPEPAAECIRTRSIIARSEVDWNEPATALLSLTNTCDERLLVTVDPFPRGSAWPRLLPLRPFGRGTARLEYTNLAPGPTRIGATLTVTSAHPETAHAGSNGIKLGTVRVRSPWLSGPPGLIIGLVALSVLGCILMARSLIDRHRIPRVHGAAALAAAAGIVALGIGLTNVSTAMAAFGMVTAALAFDIGFLRSGLVSSLMSRVKVAGPFQFEIDVERVFIENLQAELETSRSQSEMLGVVDAIVATLERGQRVRALEATARLIAYRDRPRVTLRDSPVQSTDMLLAILGAQLQNRDIPFDTFELERLHALVADGELLKELREHCTAVLQPGLERARGTGDKNERTAMLLTHASQLEHLANIAAERPSGALAYSMAAHLYAASDRFDQALSLLYMSKHHYPHGAHSNGALGSFEKSADAAIPLLEDALRLTVATRSQVQNDRETLQKYAGTPARDGLDRALLEWYRVHRTHKLPELITWLDRSIASFQNNIAYKLVLQARGTLSPDAGLYIGKALAYEPKNPHFLHTAGVIRLRRGEELRSRTELLEALDLLDDALRHLSDSQEPEDRQRHLKKKIAVNRDLTFKLLGSNEATRSEGRGRET